MLNNEALERQVIKKYMEEMKRLRVEVGALQEVMVNRGRKNHEDDASLLSVEEESIK